VVPADQVSKAIGKGGVNIRLATQLTNFEIDVYREVEDEDDIDIFEFADDFGDDVVQLLYDIGCDTARSVLELSPEELERRTEGKARPQRCQTHHPHHRRRV
jgi:transcription termination/antitermination protein NusA